MDRPETSPAVGDIVTYVDEHAVPHKAIVTANWGGTNNPDTAINVVYVTGDEKRTDQYGRQIERACSVVPRHLQGAPGRYYILS